METNMHARMTPRLLFTGENPMEVSSAPAGAFGEKAMSTAMPATVWGIMMGTSMIASRIDFPRKDWRARK
jgi:hypothetical protein